MFLVVCATDFEMQALTDRVSPKQDRWLGLVTGVGMVETALNLSRYLEQTSGSTTIQGVLNFGVAGAYIRGKRKGADLLDICLAESEVFGDFGICFPDRIEALNDSLVHRRCYDMDAGLLGKAEKLFVAENMRVSRGTFVTVCGVSGTQGRGDILSSQYDGLCENMEGAAVARVCEAYDLPLLEMRTISNFVEDRNLSRWKLPEACARAGEAVAILLKGLPDK